MSFILPFESKKVLVPTGQYIMIISLGEGNTKIYKKNASTQETSAPILIDTLNGAYKTYGTYANDIYITIEPNGSMIEYAVGTAPQAQTAVFKNFGTSSAISVIAPAITFINPAISDNSGNTTLTSLGVHGLTSAVAVGKSIYITWSSGTAKSGLYAITGIDTDTTGVAITISLPYSLSLGTPNVTLAGTAILISSSIIPAYTLKQGSTLQVEVLSSNTVSSNNKTLVINYDGSNILNYAIGATIASLLVFKRLYQSTFTQIISNAVNVVGYGTSTGSIVKNTVNCAVDNTLSIYITLAVANEYFTVESYRAQVQY